MSTFDMASAGSPAAGAWPRLANALWRASVGALAAMPLGMAIAHRSSPLFLVLSALCALGATAAEGRLRGVAREALEVLMRPLGLTVLGFLGWSLLSVIWSDFRLVSLGSLGEFWLPVAAGFVLTLTLARRLNRQAFWLLGAAFLAACAMIVLELATGLTLRQSLGRRADSFIFNRPVITLLVLAAPLAAWFLGRFRHGWALALGLVLLLAGVALTSDSGAAVLGLAVAVPAALLAWSAPRTTLWAAAAAFLVALLTAPLLGPVAHGLMPPALHDKLAGGHTRERVEVWLSFGAAVREQPLLGAGFGISPRMAETEAGHRVSSGQATMLAIGHPHNTPLQIWVELGFVGVALALAAMLLTLRAIAGEPHLTRSASFALIAGAATVALVGHGAWQGWWAASLAAAVTWMLALVRTQPETKP